MGRPGWAMSQDKFGVDTSGEVLAGMVPGQGMRGRAHRGPPRCGILRGTLWRDRPFSLRRPSPSAGERRCASACGDQLVASLIDDERRELDRGTLPFVRNRLSSSWGEV
jgi:hypothetical protein